MKLFISFVIKETKHIIRDKRTMLMLFGMPIVMMLLFGFAITNDVVIIMLGLAIGAMFVRSMTIFLVEKGTLDEFVYLEHGAHYAIGALAIIMLLSPSILSSNFDMCLYSFLVSLSCKSSYTCELSISVYVLTFSSIRPGFTVTIKVGLLRLVCSSLRSTSITEVSSLLWNRLTSCRSLLLGFPRQDLTG